MAGKFKAGLKAAKNLESEPKNQKTKKPENQYTEAEMKLVNVSGFKVPAIVRTHWQIEAKRQGLPLSRFVREKLIEQYGLPEGIEL